MRSRTILIGLVLATGAVWHARAQEALPPLLDASHPSWSEVAPERFRARFHTTRGDFVVEVFRRWSPHGADRLYNLVRLGYYDDTRVHRVRDGVFAQFGLSGDPAVNRVWYENRIPDDPRRRSNLRGAVSFAMLEEPDTRTTQLFVNLRDNPEYDAGGFVPIGRVVEGMDVVDGLYAGYGDRSGGGMRAGRQGRVVAEGNAYLDTEFPLLDHIEKASIEPGTVMRFPDVGANRIRAEVHLLPAVSTGPLDPTWSPDGTRLAFSMRGDIWVMDAGGGEAVAVTRGPAYYFEPAWSPDGDWIAFSRDLDGNLDVGAVRAAGGDPVMLTAHEHVDLQPTWSPDGRHVYFASARGGSFDVYRVPFAGEGSPAEALEPVVVGPGHQIQPAVSPDGSTLAFISPVAGHLGTGGLWTLPLESAVAADRALQRATLVHYEETSYRTKPAWTADGHDLVFVSDTAGSDDLAVVPATGGSVARLTWDAADELDPAVAPGGDRIAFVSNRTGPTRLAIVGVGGARREDWTRVTVGSLRPALPTGQLVVRVLDEDGAPLASRIQVLASDERGYTPEGGFHRVISATDIHYFHTDREATLLVPVGPVQVEAWHGPETLPARAEVVVEPGRTVHVELRPRRLIDMQSRGWVGGDTHSHDLHQGRYGLSHEDYFRQLVAEDLQVTNALIHMDGTRLMGRWEDLTGEPSPLSTRRHVLQYAQEFRGSFGHVGLLGIFEFAMPLVGGTGGTAFAADVLNADWLDAAHAQGGIGGYMHPYSRPVREPQDAAGSEIALDVALGKGDFYDVANYPYDDLVNAGMYWRFLNAGFRLPATGGSDNFADVWRDAPPGSARTYARVDLPADAPVQVPAWLRAVRAGHTFATNGPLLLLHVTSADYAGRSATGTPTAGPGDVLALGPQATTTLEVTVEVASVAPLDRVEILVNGRSAETVDARGRGHTFTVRRTVRIPGSGWVAAMAVGPAARAVTDGYPFAHTSPVFVVRDGRRYADPTAASFLADVVRAQWQRVLARDRFPDAAARERYRQAAQEAIRVYEEIAAAH